MNAAIRTFVQRNLGMKFTEPPPFDLAKSYKESDCCTPLIFILSQGGVDPTTELIKFAEDRGFADTLGSIMLGQGQVRKLKKYILMYRNQPVSSLCYPGLQRYHNFSLSVSLSVWKNLNICNNLSIHVNLLPKKIWRNFLENWLKNWRILSVFN